MSFQANRKEMVARLVVLHKEWNPAPGCECADIASCNCFVEIESDPDPCEICPFTGEEKDCDNCDFSPECK